MMEYCGYEIVVWMTSWIETTEYDVGCCWSCWYRYGCL